MARITPKRWHLLKRLHRGLEGLWLSATAHPKWAARYQERLGDEAKIYRASRAYLDEIEKQLGQPKALARIARAAWASPTGQQAGAGKLIEARLTEHLKLKLDPAKVMGPVLGEFYAVARRSEKSAAALFGGQPRPEPVAKQIAGVAWSGEAQTFTEYYPELAGQVSAYMENTAGVMAGKVAHTLTQAADPAHPKTIDQTVKAIKSDLWTTKQSQARTIARTETARVYGQTSRTAMVNNGITRARWMTAAGSPAAALVGVCDFCEECASEGFRNLSKGYGKAGVEAPPYHPNCRCDLAADVEGWLPPQGALPTVPTAPRPYTPTLPRLPLTGRPASTAPLAGKPKPAVTQPVPPSEPPTLPRPTGLARQQLIDEERRLKTLVQDGLATPEQEARLNEVRAQLMGRLALAKGRGRWLKHVGRWVTKRRLRR